MGREWLYWVGGATRRRRTSAGIINQDDTTSPGCMCAVFHLFDLHHFNLPLNHHQHSLTPYLQQQQQPKGVEAPRNSLELEEPPPPPPPSVKPPPIQEEDHLNFPAGIQIKTRSSVSASKEECSLDSPGTKTPSLVARLMGLDLLPETDSSPSPSLSKPQTKSQLKQSSKDRTRCFYEDDINVGARSLPERRSDVEYHRLSLQINKENNNTNQEFSKTRFRQQDENRSPAHYAKQIVKQVRESVSRRVGLDITNTNRDSDENRRDQNLILKLSKKSIAHDTSTKQSNTPSSSPKLRILDTKKNKPAAETTSKSPRNSTSSDANPPKPKHQEHQPHNKIGSSVKKLSPQTCDKAIRNKKEEAFVRSPAANRASLTEKKSKKAPLSIESGPTILPVKKGPSPPATKLPQKQAQVSVSDALSSKRNTQLSSNTSRSYKQLPLRHHHHHPDKTFTVPENVLPDSTNGCATSAAAVEYKCYIQKILKRAGIIDKLTPLTLGKWHTPSHPLDPSIFYYLELFHPAAAPSASLLSYRCNRKLIFQLVDELLVDILRPHLDYKPWISPAAASASDHFALADELCRKIESFPGADCRVLEDIDLLVDKDLQGKSPLCLEEEGERLVREIEGEIVERLVSETVAAAVVDGVRTGRQKGWVSRGPGSSHVTRCH